MIIIKIRTLFLGLLFLALTIVYVAWVYTSELTDFGGDSAGYLLAARYYSPYHSLSPVLVDYKSQIVYPPLFPWLMAIFDGGYNILRAHIMVAAFALGSFAVLYLWLRKELMSWEMSSIIVLIYAFMPATYQYALNIWTEFPFVFCSLCAILLMAKADASTSLRVWIYAALFVAAATLVRVAALPLLAAFGVFLLIKRPHRFLMIGLIAALPFALWALYSSHSEVGAGAYLTHWNAKYAIDPFKVFMTQLTGEVNALLSSWESAWLGHTYSKSLKIVIFGFGTIGLLGWLYRLKSCTFDAIYFAIYLVVLLTWPHPEEAMRYASVVYPVLLAYGFLLLALANKLPLASKMQSLSTSLTAALLVLVMLPTLISNIQSFFEPVELSLSASTHTAEWYGDSRDYAKLEITFHARLLEHLKEIQKNVPDSECVFSIKPTVISLYTNRSSYTPPKISDSDDKFNEGIKRCKYAYLLPFSSPSYGVSLYPHDRLGAKAKILSTMKMPDSDGASVVGALVEILP